MSELTRTAERWLQPSWAALLAQLRARPGASALIILWTLVMIAVPIGLWTVGEASTPVMMLIAVCLQAAAVLLLLRSAWGWRRALLTAVGIAFMGWGLEAVGTATGLPFGDYVYTERLQPQIFHVPLLIPLAWFMGLPLAWAVAESILGERRSLLSLGLLAAAGMVAWDLFLDPQMVHWEFWVWLDPGTFSYFGIPWLNYFGWFIGSLGMTLVVRPPSVRPVQRPLLIIYSITWFLEFFGLLFFWGLIGPALVGGVVMGGLMLLAWKRGG